FGFIERYGLLFIEILLSLLLIYVGYRYFNQQQPWDYLKLTLMNRMGVMGIILMIESTLTIYLIKRFQSHNVSTYLKGSE
ncbi:MAG TPA: hypothetical protein VKY25_04830, partial [Erysipelothrix sp.]|nr:hypothetical protein [Erysipelothrix sp.]